MGARGHDRLRQRGVGEPLRHGAGAADVQPHHLVRALLKTASSSSSSSSSSSCSPLLLLMLPPRPRTPFHVPGRALYSAPADLRNVFFLVSILLSREPPITAPHEC